MRIPLGGEQFTVVDDDQSHLAAHTWHVVKVGRVGRTPHIYAARNVKRNGKWTTEYMHQVIAEAPHGLRVDHRDGDGLNNRRANLRVVTHSQNMQNRDGVQRNNMTGIRGVFWNAASQRFEARVVVDGRFAFRKTFPTLADAAAAVTEARRQLMPFSADASTPTQQETRDAG